MPANLGDRFLAGADTGMMWTGTAGEDGALLDELVKEFGGRK